MNVGYAWHTLFKFPGFSCVSLVASPPLWKYLSTSLVGNPIIKILDTPLTPIGLRHLTYEQLSESLPYTT